MPYNKSNNHQQSASAKPSQSYWDIKDAKTQRSIMIGQAYNISCQEMINCNPKNEEHFKNLKERTKLHYKNLKELHEEMI